MYETILTQKKDVLHTRLNGKSTHAAITELKKNSSSHQTKHTTIKYSEKGNTMEKRINFKLLRLQTIERMEYSHISIYRKVQKKSGWHFLLLVYSMREWESVSPSFRAWNGNTFTHNSTYILAHTHIATYIILNSTQRFKWFVLYTFYTIPFITILYFSRVCTRVVCGCEYVSIYVCTFVPFV